MAFVTVLAHLSGEILYRKLFCRECLYAYNRVLLGTGLRGYVGLILGEKYPLKSRIPDTIDKIIGFDHLRIGPYEVRPDGGPEESAFPEGLDPSTDGMKKLKITQRFSYRGLYTYTCCIKSPPHFFLWVYTPLGLSQNNLYSFRFLKNTYKSSKC